MKMDKDYYFLYFGIALASLGLLFFGSDLGQYLGTEGSGGYHTGLQVFPERAIDVASGDDFACLLIEDTEQGSFLKCENEPGSQSPSDAFGAYIEKFDAVNGKKVEIDGEDNGLCMLYENDALACLGNGDFSSTGGFVGTAVLGREGRLNDVSNVKQFSVGDSHSCVLFNNNKAMCGYDPWQSGDSVFLEPNFDVKHVHASQEGGLSCFTKSGGNVICEYCYTENGELLCEEDYLYNGGDAKAAYGIERNEVCVWKEDDSLFCERTGGLSMSGVTKVNTWDSHVCLVRNGNVECYYKYILRDFEEVYSYNGGDAVDVSVGGEAAFEVGRNGKHVCILKKDGSAECRDMEDNELFLSHTPGGVAGQSESFFIDDFSWCNENQCDFIGTHNAITELAQSEYEYENGLITDSEWFAVEEEIRDGAIKSGPTSLGDKSTFRLEVDLPAQASNVIYTPSFSYKGDGGTLIVDLINEQTGRVINCLNKDINTDWTSTDASQTPDFTCRTISSGEWTFKFTFQDTGATGPVDGVLIDNLELGLIPLS